MKGREGETEGGKVEVWRREGGREGRREGERGIEMKGREGETEGGRKGRRE